MRRLARVAVLIGVLQVFGIPALRAETVGCMPIVAVPTTITTPGIYCLTGNLAMGMTPVVAITIAASNVVLDLNGWMLDGAAAGPDTVSDGIRAHSQQNITIRNGTVRGFRIGIGLSDSAPYTSNGYVVEDIRAAQNLSMGMYVVGRGSIVRRNQVVATGSTVTSALANAYGIIIGGPQSRVLDNDVMATTSHGTLPAFGVYFLNNAPDGLVVGNRITHASVGVLIDTPNIKYRDNVTSGVTTPYSGGTDVGNNQ
jgi:hypothetical protein